LEELITTLESWRKQEPAVPRQLTIEKERLRWRAKEGWPAGTWVHRVKRRWLGLTPEHRNRLLALGVSAPRPKEGSQGNSAGNRGSLAPRSKSARRGRAPGSASGSEARRRVWRRPNWREEEKLRRLEAVDQWYTRHPNQNITGTKPDLEYDGEDGTTVPFPYKQVSDFIATCKARLDCVLKQFGLKWEERVKKWSHGRQAGASHSGFTVNKRLTFQAKVAKIAAFVDKWKRGANAGSLIPTTARIALPGNCWQPEQPEARPWDFVTWLRSTKWSAAEKAQLQKWDKLIVPPKLKPEAKFEVLKGWFDAHSGEDIATARPHLPLPDGRSWRWTEINNFLNSNILPGTAGHSRLVRDKSKWIDISKTWNFRKNTHRSQNTALPGRVGQNQSFGEKANMVDQWIEDNPGQSIPAMLSVKVPASWGNKKQGVEAAAGGSGNPAGELDWKMGSWVSKQFERLRKGKAPGGERVIIEKWRHCYVEKAGLQKGGKNSQKSKNRD